MAVFTFTHKGWSRSASMRRAYQVPVRVYRDGEYFQYFLIIAAGPDWDDHVKDSRDEALAMGLDEICELMKELPPDRVPGVALLVRPDYYRKWRSRRQQRRHPAPHYIPYEQYPLFSLVASQ